jgi:hypothetical protein
MSGDLDLAQVPTQGVDEAGGRTKVRVQNADDRDTSSPLGPRVERRGEKAGRRRNERSPVHYSITSSARASTEGGIVRPSALAVFRLTTSSNLEGRSIGRSPGFAPLRMRST